MNRVIFSHTVFIAAGSWPAAVVLALLVAVPLWYAASRFSQSSTQRVGNVLIGAVGALFGLMCWGYLLPKPKPNSLAEDLEAWLIAGSMALGALISITLIWLSRRVLRRKP